MDTSDRISSVSPSSVELNPRGYALAEELPKGALSKEVRENLTKCIDSGLLCKKFAGNVFTKACSSAEDLEAAPVEVDIEDEIDIEGFVLVEPASAAAGPAVDPSVARFGAAIAKFVKPAGTEPILPQGDREQFRNAVRIYSEILDRHPVCYTGCTDGGAFRLSPSMAVQREILDRIFSLDPSLRDAYISSVKIHDTGNYDTSRVEFLGMIPLEIGYAALIFKKMITILANEDPKYGQCAFHKGVNKKAELQNLLDNTKLPEILCRVLDDTDSVWYRAHPGAQSIPRERVWENFKKGFPALEGMPDPATIKRP